MLQSLVGKSPKEPVPNISNQTFPITEARTHILGPSQPVG